jgi:hypothetical protein
MATQDDISSTLLLFLMTLMSWVFHQPVVLQHVVGIRVQRPRLAGGLPV